LREKSIIIYQGKGCLKDKVFQVGNIGELSFDNIQFFLASLKNILLEFDQAKEKPIVTLGGKTLSLNQNQKYREDIFGVVDRT
jgi:2-aminoethylphosphonate-pyruvate transaminase